MTRRRIITARAAVFTLFIASALAGSAAPNCPPHSRPYQTDADGTVHCECDRDAGWLLAAGTCVTADQLVRREQDDFNRMNAAWLRAQAQLISQAVEQDRAWRNAVLTALRNIQVPEPEHRPRSLHDLRAGDILLYGMAV